MTRGANLRVLPSDERRCKGIVKRTGERCTNYAVNGDPEQFCSGHGKLGVAGHARSHERERILDASVDELDSRTRSISGALDRQARLRAVREKRAAEMAKHYEEVDRIERERKEALVEYMKHPPRELTEQEKARGDIWTLMTPEDGPPAWALINREEGLHQAERELPGIAAEIDLRQKQADNERTRELHIQAGRNLADLVLPYPWAEDVDPALARWAGVVLNPERMAEFNDRARYLGEDIPFPSVEPSYTYLSRSEYMRRLHKRNRRELERVRSAYGYRGDPPS